MKKAILLILISSSVILSQNYKKIKIHFTEKNEISTLISIGIPVEESIINKKDKSITIFVSDNDLKKINELGFLTETLIENWNEYFNNRAQIVWSELLAQRAISKAVYNVSGFGFGSLGGFYTVGEVNNKLDSMRLRYPSIITQKFQIGSTVEGRPIYAVKISDSPEIDEDEPEVFYNAMIHAREPQGMMVLMYFMYYLLENYNVDPEVTYLVNNRELYFVPVINVDGYEFNRIQVPQGGGMYRKNKNGVDLNRNFGYQWGYDDIGSSGNPDNETYRGISAFSEPETQAIRDLCNSRHFVNVLNYHTFSNLLISPWGYVNEESPDSLIFRDFSIDITKYNNYAWGTSGDLLYNTNGDSDDWMYGEQTSKKKIFSMTPEVGGDADGFWPPVNRIFPLAEENLRPNLYIAWTAGAFVTSTGFSCNKEYINPGETIEISPVFKNKGLEDIQSFTAELIPLDNKSSVTNPFLSFEKLNSRNSLTSSSAFTVTIASNASILDEIKLLLKVHDGNLTMSQDTIHLKLGIPKIIFTDTSDIITNFWNTQGAWAVTNTDYHSAPGSYTDSKNGVYNNNSEVSLTLKNNIDLTGHNNPVLTFYTKYDIEKGWDYGQVKLSKDNGLSWNALKGNFTRTGSENQVTEPVYDGRQESWVREEMDLSAYAGSKIKIKFVLKTDGWTQRDGWYVDDISIIYYSVLPVELAAFSVTPEKNMVRLSWTTASELNNSGFTLQRSSDKLTWTDIQFIQGHGTSTSQNKYIYYDQSPLNGRSWYRLVQFDYNGAKQLFEPSEVDASDIFDYSLSQNYPNPFNPETVIAYTLAESGFVTLKIYDITGSECAALVSDYQDPGKYESILNAGKLGLSSGTYIYSLKINNFASQRKLLIIK